jgi:predicted component of type VI protein secretion system
MTSETHEADLPINWPYGHGGVELTDDHADECIEVRIHGVKHYLRSSTARELSNMLNAKIDEWNLVAKRAEFPGV